MGHGPDATERPPVGPHGRPRSRARRRGLRLALAGLAVAGAAACGGGPSASVGVTPVGDTLEVRAKACGDAGLERVDLVDPAAPDRSLWRAELAEGPAARRLRIGPAVPGYAVADDRPSPLPEGPLRVLARATDGASWGGPRFRPASLAPGTIRVAGQDVDLDRWEAEPARCPRVGLAGALVAGAATAGAAGLLWSVVRLVARAISRPGPSPPRPAAPG